MTDDSKNISDAGIAIEVKGVSKAYRIWKNPAARLKYPILKALGGVLPRALHPRALQKRIGDADDTHYYKDFYALKDISLTVRRGESVGIIGRNGSGKSTLLQIIAGTLTPTSGTIKTNGRVAALLELGSGFNPEFTGRENVYLNASILGLTQNEIDDRYEAIADFADIGDFIDQPVKTYSSGMMMRLAFAVIAHVDADILIVDEALAVGDVFFVQKCMRFIREFQKNGTLLLVTHDTSTVTSLCQRALWLYHGETAGAGTAKTITEDYLEAVYAERQGVVLFHDEKKSQKPVANLPEYERVIDQRADFINRSNLRNDMEVFDFNPNSPGFGAGGMQVEEVRMLDAVTRQPLSYVVGGEEILLSVKVRAKTDLDRPIVGFILKNNLGQYLIADNTYMSYRDNPRPLTSGDLLTAEFCFQMPYLPIGDYVYCIGCANGTQDNNIQHHWMHEALSFRSHSSHIMGSVLGIPMRSISLLTESGKDAHA